MKKILNAFQLQFSLYFMNLCRGYGQNTLQSTGFGTEQFSTGDYSDPGGSAAAAAKPSSIKEDRDAYRVMPVQQPAQHPVPPLHLMSHDEDTMPSRTPRTPGGMSV